MGNYKEEIKEIENLTLSGDIKKLLIELKSLEWDWKDWNNNNGSHAFRVAEGIKLASDVIIKHNKPE